MADAAKLQLGGEKRELTVLFSDIRGFTTLSEAMAPEELVKLMNEYFTVMTGKVFEQRGSLDKYIGDAIMAMFGAPVAEPRHAAYACRAAIEMVRALQPLRRAGARGIPPIDIGVGINTGPMVVGNMGSASRFNYTVGDAVNPARASSTSTRSTDQHPGERIHLRAGQGRVPRRARGGHGARARPRAAGAALRAVRR